jgi:S-adenosylmethionine hydrolase
VPPVVTLLTDFGHSDSYVAEMKAVLVNAAPQARLIDVTHDIPPGDLSAAAYVLERAWHRFPEGTVHLAVVDPGVGSSRRALAVASGRHYFVGPDNGLLSPVLEGANAVELSIPPGASATFHGRDVFAPAAAQLASGEDFEQLGRAVVDPVQLTPQGICVDGNTVIGVVVYVDRFGTLITNIPSNVVSGSGAVVIGGEHVAQTGQTFSDVEPGALVAFAGSGGTLEIAARNRSAAQLAGVGVGAEVRVRRS